MNLEQPKLLWALIPLILLVFFLIRKQFVKVDEDDDAKARKKRVRRVMLVSRTIMLALLMIAIAGPFSSTQSTIAGDPVVKVLVDNSSSMDAIESFDTSLIDNIKKKVDVEVYTVGKGNTSNIGDEVLSHLGPYESVLLVSDGNVNKGSDLGDVALFAQRINSTINTVRLKTKVDDVAVFLGGPSKTSADADTTFEVSTTGQNVPTKVTVDGKLVFNGLLTGSKKITHKFSRGFHKIVAQIQRQDHYAQNNIYYKTIKAVEPPKILFVTEKGESSLLTLLRQVYTVDVAASVPDDLSPYYAVLMNDIPAASANKYVPTLTNYLTEGNGLVVLGGKDSYDLGNYRNSIFEKLLPVHVGQPARREGDNNIVIVIDISGSTGGGLGRGKAVDVEKALAIDVLDNDISPETRVGVVAFNNQAFTVSDMDFLGNRKSVLNDRISRLKDGGGTQIGVGLLKALQMLETVSGSKNIILISDGRTQAENIALETVKLAANSGVRIYTVGVGEITREHVMVQYADMTGGIYFKATDANRINLLFGRPEKESGNKKSLVVLNKNHDMTVGLDNLTAIITGYNQVSPKTTGQLLISTSDGTPVLTVGRVGLGRVATLATDDGMAWSGDLLGTANSEVHTRMVDWAIGEPDRKDQELVMVSDTRINQPTTVVVKSPKQPKVDGTSFIRTSANTYASTITPTQTGFHTLLDATFAVNYPSEYDSIGQGDALEFVVTATKGNYFDQKDVESIVEAAKTRAKRTIIAREYTRWPYILAVILLFLLEIFIRRYYRTD